jgi:hypothetical protein
MATGVGVSFALEATVDEDHEATGKIQSKEPKGQTTIACAQEPKMRD